MYNTILQKDFFFQHNQILYPFLTTAKNNNILKPLLGLWQPIYLVIQGGAFIIQTIANIEFTSNTP